MTTTTKPKPKIERINLTFRDIRLGDPYNHYQSPLSSSLIRWLQLPSFNYRARLTSWCLVLERCISPPETRGQWIDVHRYILPETVKPWLDQYKQWFDTEGETTMPRPIIVDLIAKHILQ